MTSSASAPEPETEHVPAHRTVVRAAARGAETAGAAGAAGAATGPAGRRRLRATRRVFWDLAVAMVGLGLAVGVVFPPFAVVLGVDRANAQRPAFIAACLAAGFLVGAANYALCRVVVGSRLAVLSTRLRSVADRVAESSRTGDWSGSTSRIEVDSDDQLGATAQAFNSLLDALETGEHFRSLVRNASDVITVVDGTGRITYQTPSVLRLLGRTPAELVGTDVQQLVHPDDRPALHAQLRRAATEDGSAPSSVVVSRMQHRDGSWRWVETVVRDLLADPFVSGVVLTTRDVSERKELEERLLVQAFHDPLTGLPNRALFMERLREAEARGQADGSGTAVLFCDLDNLKAVNDSLGHEQGDVLLQVVTSRMRGCVREQDVVARLAGDEFAVLLAGTDCAEAAQRVADRILAALREPVHLAGRWVHTGMSIGAASTATCSGTGVDLLRAADVAMYVAKATGKGRTEVFRPGHHAEEVERDRLRADLQRALDEQQFELYYQPVVELATGTTTALEALLRWHHPVRGLVPPSVFIPLAEENGLIVPIGRWVTQQATRQAAQWQDGERPLRMSVNVSARQFLHPGLVEDVAAALSDSGLSPQQLILEITETLLVEDTAETARKLAELSALGVRIALDDFGTGFSSLSYLRRFPLDVLKVDKSFVDRVVTSEEDRAVVGAVVQLGRTLGLDVVVEGLENADQVAVLTRLGCPLAQGFHFARPMPAAEVATHLARTSPARC